MKSFIESYGCFRMYHQWRNRRVTIAVLVAILTAAGLYDYSRADQAYSSDSGDLEMPPGDSVPADSLPPAPAKPVTAGPATVAEDSVMLEAILYQPGPDTVLIAAYRTREERQQNISPTSTMLKSVAFPGWGQFSNGKYIKAGLIFVIESYFIYRAVDFGRKASDWRDKWKAEPDTSAAKVTYFNQYADYRDTRNSYIWYSVLTIFLSMIDAYVDAHLQNFPEDIPTSERVSLDFEPGRETRLSLSLRF